MATDKNPEEPGTQGDLESGLPPEACREHRQWMETLLEQTRDAVLTADPATGALLQFNSRAHTDLGYTREEFEKVTLQELELDPSAAASGRAGTRFRRCGAR